MTTLEDLGLTADDVERGMRITRAHRVLAKVLIDSDKWAAGSLLGIAVEWLLELGYSEQQILETTEKVIRMIPEIGPQMNRLQMHVVKNE